MIPPKFPLENLVVLDLTRVLAGPYCTMLLADMGATVIKIEKPIQGDDTRQYPPFRLNINGEKESLYFANINRNKKGITLNLKTDEGRKIFIEMVKTADVVVENFRPGVMERLGIGYSELKKVNPRIIYGAISGFGDSGPYRLRPAYDIIGQAMGGLMAITGQPDSEPTRAGSAIGDVLAGLNLTIGILAAVNARNLTNEGQKIDISLMDSVIAATENTAIKYIESGIVPPRMGNRYSAISPFDAFNVKDGKIIIACGNQKLFEKMCIDALKCPEMISDKRFADMQSRLDNQRILKEKIEDKLKNLSVSEAVEKLLRYGVPTSPIYDISEILADPQTKNREMFVKMQHPTLGEITVNGCPIKFSDTKASIRTSAPILGEYNYDVLSQMGLSNEEIESYKERGIV